MRRVQHRDIHVSDEEEKRRDEDNFVVIENGEEDEHILSVIGGSFSTTSRGIKPKRTKGKESWIFNHGFRVQRQGELYWKCYLCKR